MESAKKVSPFLSFFHYIGKKTMNVINNIGAAAVFFRAY